MSEFQQHEAVVRWCQIIGAKEYPHLRMNGKFPIVHFNNNAVNETVGALKKRLGVFKGIPDLFLPVKSRGFSGLWIEMKDGKKKPKPEQQACIDFLASQGYKSCVCFSAKHAVETIREYLSG